MHVSSCSCMEQVAYLHMIPREGDSRTHAPLYKYLICSSRPSDVVTCENVAAASYVFADCSSNCFRASYIFQKITVDSRRSLRPPLLGRRGLW